MNLITFAIKNLLLQTPLVSVIVPIYNMEKYLDQCLNSILNQDFENFEVILVNDGSKDNSGSIMQKWSEKDSRFKSYHKDNGGLSSARNFGITKAKGEFIAFVDSDDQIKENFLGSLVELLQDNEADIAFCNLEKVNENGTILQKLPQCPEILESEISSDSFNYFGELSWFACNKIFKKEILKNWSFLEGIYFEDIASIPLLFLKTKKIVKSNQYLYQYLEREGSITRSYNEKGLDMFKATDHVKRAYQDSSHAEDIIQWKRFFILQGFYSYLAYVARVKEPKLRNKMYHVLKEKLNEEHICKKDILKYNRFGRNYLNSLSPLKRIYYMFVLIFKT